MPVHNGAEFLSETLDSLAREVDDCVEIILIDSSDDDACKEIVQRYDDRLSIDYSHRADLKPWPAKTNEAVRRAKAPHIAMLHQDDLWLPGRAKDMQAAIRVHPSATMYLAASRIIDSKSKKLGVWRCPFGKRTVWQGHDLIERLLVQNFIAIPAPVICRESWLAVGGMDENLWYTADWDLYLKLAGLGEFIYSTAPTTAFRIHGTSLTVKGSNNYNTFQEQMDIVTNRYKILLPEIDRFALLSAVSTKFNVALAAASRGNFTYLFRAAFNILRLSPADFILYIYYSRIFERVWPRLRARLRGGY
jgi:glycosyltransferase involved in cell wall biosynthesis